MLEERIVGRDGVDPLGLDVGLNRNRAPEIEVADIRRAAGLLGTQQGVERNEGAGLVRQREAQELVGGLVDAALRPNPKPLSNLPPAIVWAWERPEKLDFVDTDRVGVAFLAKT